MQKISLVPYKKTVSSNKKTKYVIKIRFIIYAIVKTQINILFTMSMISCFAKNSGPDYFRLIDQILKYLTGN